MKKRLTALLLSLCMTFSLLQGVAPPAAAAKASQFDSILNMGQPSEFDPASTENPYGYAVDQPFLMNEMSELGIYGINKNGEYNSFMWYDGWDGESDSIPQNFGKDAVNGSFSSYDYYAYKNDGNMKKMSFVEAVAFDPNGTGRKDHIAYIGFDSGNNKIVLYAHDAKDGKTYAEYAFPGNASWIKNSNPQNWTAGNYFAITAGDYDGDGRETLVAFVTADNDKDYGLYEINWNNGSLRADKSGKNLLHWRYVNEKPGQDMANTTNNRGNKLCADLATGDFNGDGKDDLAAVSYLLDPPDNYQHLDCEYYLPMLAVSYGRSGADPTADSDRKSVYLAVDNGYTLITSF